MNTLTEALICVVMGCIVAVGFYLAIILDESRTNHDNPMAEWVIMDGGGR
jgi:hypothetical protein